MAPKMWLLACLLLLAACSFAAAAEPQAAVEPAHFKQCPRACRVQRMDPATYCRTCSACAGYNTRFSGEHHVQPAGCSACDV
jgi:hypothetical protein